MFDVQNYFIMLVILLNLVNILSLTIDKVSYSDEIGIKLMSNSPFGLDIFLVLYSFLLFSFSINLLCSGRSIAGFVVLVLSVTPFVIEKKAEFKEKDFFVDWQIKALILNLFIICVI